MTRTSERDRRLAANALEFLFLQHAQQLDLGGRRNVADFIQKNCSAVGNLKPAFAHGNRAGERAFFVAEQFAFDDGFRQRGAVEFHKRLAFARALLVQRAGHQFLAHAGLAADEHGGARCPPPARCADKPSAWRWNCRSCSAAAGSSATAPATARFPVAARSDVPR